MKKLLLSFALLMGVSIYGYCTPAEYTVVDSTTATYPNKGSRAVHKLNGKFIMYTSTASSTEQFVVDDGSVTALGSITAPKFYGDGSSLTGVSVVSTYTYTLGSGGDVFVASGTYLPIMGCFKVIEQSPWTITGLKAFCLNTSTVSATSFNIRYSTTTDGTGTSTTLSDTSISVSSGSCYSNWVDLSSTTVVPSMLWLETNDIPASGTLPSNYGVTIRYTLQP